MPASECQLRAAAEPLRPRTEAEHEYTRMIQNQARRRATVGLGLYVIYPAQTQNGLLSIVQVHWQARRREPESLSLSGCLAVVVPADRNSLLPVCLPTRVARASCWLGKLGSESAIDRDTDVTVLPGTTSNPARCDS